LLNFDADYGVSASMKQNKKMKENLYGENLMKKNKRKKSNRAFCRSA